MTDPDPQAARAFYREVRCLAETAPPWATDVIFYQTRPDETFDLTLVSRRVYGRTDEVLAVMAAAGLDTLDQALPQKRIVLPDERQLLRIKRRCGFESQSVHRRHGQPVWRRD